MSSDIRRRSSSTSPLPATCPASLGLSLLWSFPGSPRAGDPRPTRRISRPLVVHGPQPAKTVPAPSVRLQFHPGWDQAPTGFAPRALPPCLPKPCRGGVVARLRRLTRELERPGQHGRHGGGPGARARARVLPGSVVPSGRCGGLGPVKVGALRRGKARRSSCAAASTPTCKRLQALLPPTRSQAPYLAGDFTSLSLSSSVK